MRTGRVARELLGMVMFHLSIRVLTISVTQINFSSICDIFLKVLYKFTKKWFWASLVFR